MSRTPSTLGLALLTVPAALLAAGGGLVAFRPEVLEAAPELRTLLAGVDPGTVVFALVILLVVFAPALGLAGRLRPAGPTPLVGDNTGNGTGRSSSGRAGFEDPSAGRVVGAAIDEWITLATAYDDEPRDVRDAARERLLESLRPIAATAYANRAGVGREAARTAIEAGTWTDDPRAAAFLAAADGPSTPLWLWLLDLLLTPDPFVAHLEATIDEIERLQSAATVAAPRADATDDSPTNGSGESTATAEVPT